MIHIGEHTYRTGLNVHPRSDGFIVAWRWGDTLWYLRYRKEIRPHFVYKKMKADPGNWTS